MFDISKQNSMILQTAGSSTSSVTDLPMHAAEQILNNILIEAMPWIFVGKLMLQIVCKSIALGNGHCRRSSSLY